MLGDIAAVFHFPPSELGELSLEEIMQWHRQAGRISKAMGGKGG